MSKISKEELKKRKAELGKHARQELAKTEVMRFRLDPNNIINIYELAEKKRQHAGAMVRQWVLERMEIEMHLLSQVRTTNKVKNVTKSASNGTSLIRSTDYDHQVFDAIIHRLDFLEREIDRLSVHK